MIFHNENKYNVLRHLTVYTVKNMGGFQTVHSTPSPWLVCSCLTIEKELK